MPLMDHPNIDNLVSDEELIRELGFAAESLRGRREVTWAKYVDMAARRIQKLQRYIDAAEKAAMAAERRAESKF